MAISAVPGYGTKGKLPGYISAVRNYQPTPATIKALVGVPKVSLSPGPAPVVRSMPNAKQIALGPVFGGMPTGGSQPIPQWQLPVQGEEQDAPNLYQSALDEIHNHPLYQSALGSYNANLTSLMNALRGNVGQAVIKAGYDPTAAFQKLMRDRPDLGDFADLLRPDDIAEAANSKYSQRAIAQRAKDAGMYDLRYQMAAKGLGGSGAEIANASNLLKTQQQTDDDNLRSLISAITGGIGDYLTQKAQGRKDLGDVEAQVGELLAQTPGQTPKLGIQWGGGQINSVAQMKQWLKARGQSFDVWANQHPALARQLVDEVGG